MQQTTIELFPVGEVDAIVYQWDYSGSSNVQFAQDDSTIPIEKTRVQAASAEQIESVPMVTELPAPIILGRGELSAILISAGWSESLIPEALRVIECESRGNSTAIGDSGRSVGLFQLNKETWFRYAGTDPDMWHDPYVNAVTALATYNYDIGRGYAPWTQWTCKPW